MKEFITEDLQSFESIFKTKKGQGDGNGNRFNRVNGMVYVYQPGVHAAFSNVTPTNLANWGIEFMEPQSKKISVCRRHNYHDFLLPFLYDNKRLLLKHIEINDGNDEEREEANKDKFDELILIKDAGRNHQHTPYHCSGYAFRNGSYNETEWTLRLFHSIKNCIPEGFNMHLTYDTATNFVVFQEQYSKCEASGYYYFQGAPEMVLFPLDATSSGISMMLNEIDVIEVKKNELHHARNSTMPTEIGQMAASLHFFCVAMMLCKIRASVDDSLISSFHAKGLLLSRTNEVFLATLEGVMGGIDACEDIKVEITELMCSGNKEDLVCTAVGYLCKPSEFTVNDV